MKDFRTLKVWETSHRLALEIYKFTADFPKGEQFGLTSELRHSCASIPTNVAEGCGRDGNAEFARFLQIAMGSACETEYLLLLANDFVYNNRSISISGTGNHLCEENAHIIDKESEHRSQNVHCRKLNAECK